MFRQFLGVVLLLSVTAAQTRPPAGYDPTRNPAQDLAAAIEQATKENKRILLVVGGEWCGWCHTLENYIKNNEDVRKAWANNFVTIKVNWSTENRNERFLSRYPNVRGYPHIFVLEKDGSFLHSQETGILEIESTYSKELMLDFIHKWQPRR
jgi:thioredoxin-related protein